MGAVTYIAWKLWPDRPYLRLFVGEIAGVATILLVVLLIITLT